MSNATGVKCKKNHLRWIEKQEENKGGLDCLTPNEYCNKKMKLYYCEICGSMIFNGSFLQGEFKSIVHTCCNNSFIYIHLKI